jgi:hypothetical protein
MQPANHLLIPDGATHFNAMWSHPFEKKDGDESFIFVNGEWLKDFLRVSYDRNTCNRFLQFRPGACQIEEINIPACAKVVKTIFGDGIFIGKEGVRFVVDLINNPYDYRPCYLFKKDILTPNP